MVKNSALNAVKCTRAVVLIAARENIVGYKKLVKHKRNPRKETASFSKNTEKEVYKYGDGAVKKQSQLSGRYATYNKKGREIKNR
jgi:hypothetical protein